MDGKLHFDVCWKVHLIVSGMFTPRRFILDNCTRRYWTNRFLMFLSVCLQVDKQVVSYIALDPFLAVFLCPPLELCFDSFMNCCLHSKGVPLIASYH